MLQLIKIITRSEYCVNKIIDFVNAIIQYFYTNKKPPHFNKLFKYYDGHCDSVTLEEIDQIGINNLLQANQRLVDFINPKTICDLDENQINYFKLLKKVISPINKGPYELIFNGLNDYSNSYNRLEYCIYNAKKDAGDLIKKLNEFQELVAIEGIFKHYDSYCDSIKEFEISKDDKEYLLQQRELIINSLDKIGPEVDLDTLKSVFSSIKEGPYGLIFGNIYTLEDIYTKTDFCIYTARKYVENLYYHFNPDINIPFNLSKIFRDYDRYCSNVNTTNITEIDIDFLRSLNQELTLNFNKLLDSDPSLKMREDFIYLDRLVNTFAEGPFHLVFSGITNQIESDQEL